MSCANCAATIEESVASLDGVSSVDVNYATDEGTVAYDPEAVTLAEIHEAVADAGYEAATETVTVGITGMSCANCSESVASALGGVPGVIDADVNFATDEARVTYNPAAASPADIYDAIERAGYTPVRGDEGQEGDDESSGDRQAAARNEEIRHQRKLTLFGAA